MLEQDYEGKAMGKGEWAVVLNFCFRVNKSKERVQVNSLHTKSLEFKSAH